MAITTRPEEGTQYLLVSDSNERSEAFDSKKLSHQDLSDLAQDELFKSKLDLKTYLTESKFTDLCEEMENQLSKCNDRFQELMKIEPSNKFRVVDGQVILLDKDTLDRYNKENETSLSPLQYLKIHWNITNEHQVNEIGNCMLKGVTVPNPSGLINSGNPIGDNPTELSDKVWNKGETQVELDETTFPNHMHHSGITSGAKVQCLERDLDSKLGYNPSGMRYDLFQNDSISSGVDKQGMGGVIDKFEVNEVGEEHLLHNNLPEYRRFYAFEIREI